MFTFPTGCHFDSCIVERKSSNPSWVTWVIESGSRAGVVVENNPHFKDIKLVHTDYLPKTPHTVRAKCEPGSLVSPDIDVKFNISCTDTLPKHINAVKQIKYEIVHVQNNENQLLEIEPFVFNPSGYNGCNHITRYYASSSSTDHSKSLYQVNIWNNSVCSIVQTNNDDCLKLKLHVS